MFCYISINYIDFPFGMTKSIPFYHFGDIWMHIWTFSGNYIIIFISDISVLLKVPTNLSTHCETELLCDNIRVLPEIFVWKFALDHPSARHMDRIAKCGLQLSISIFFLLFNEVVTTNENICLCVIKTTTQKELLGWGYKYGRRCAGE